MIWSKYMLLYRMKCNFWVVFGIILISFCLSSCLGHNIVWSKSNGILTYNRISGQLEIIWENDTRPMIVIHDTVYVCPDSVNVVR